MEFREHCIERHGLHSPKQRGNQYTPLFDGDLLNMLAAASADDSTSDVSMESLGLVLSYLPVSSPIQERAMLKSDLYGALRTELHRHDFSTFVDEPPCIAQGGHGVVVTGSRRARRNLERRHNFWIIWRLRVSSIRWIDAVRQHTQSRRQSHMPIRDIFNTPYEVPRFTLRDDCLNPSLVSRSTKPFNVQYREQD